MPGPRTLYLGEKKPELPALVKTLFVPCYPFRGVQLRKDTCKYLEFLAVTLGSFNGLISLITESSSNRF
jgi:hypothetical protein